MYCLLLTHVVGGHATLDLAYLLIGSDAEFEPIAVGDSDAVRVGELVIIIGFPIASELGAEPTVSQGIVSAKRNGLIQTDAPMNPGNSGGPMLDEFGNVVGVVVSRIAQSGGSDIAGIGFAIPINEAKSDLGDDVTPGEVLNTPTPFPTIEPTPDIEATKTVIEAIDAQRRLEDQATRTAIEAEQEADRFAASLEATRSAPLRDRGACCTVWATLPVDQSATGSPALDRRVQVRVALAKLSSVTPSG